MPPTGSRRLAPRRRRTDDGEEEGSFVGDVEDDSLSEGSAASGVEDDVDGEVSDASAEDGLQDPSGGSNAIQSAQEAINDTTGTQTHKPSQQAFSTTADTEAMLNGLKVSDDAPEPEELHFDEPTADTVENVVPSQHPTNEAPKAPRGETFAQKSRREHQEYVKERDSNPAFVPNRGGFFLHDDRSTPSQSFGSKPAGRGRGRGSNGIPSTA